MTRKAVILDGRDVSAIVGTVILHIETERVDVTTRYEPDPQWTFTDAAGHFHAYSFNDRHSTLPTVNYITVQEPCNGCDDDNCEGFERREYHCLICSELVEPKTRKTTGRKYQPGLRTWRLDFRTSDTEAFEHKKTYSVVLKGFDTDEQFGVAHLQTARAEGNLTMMSLRGWGELGKRQHAAVKAL